MEESDHEDSLPITGCKVIAFRRDDHPLLGIYPPILNYSATQAISGIARDGYMKMLHATYSREAFRAEAKAGHLILFEHPQETCPDPVVMCVPAKEAPLFEGVLELQHAAKHTDISVAVLPLNASLGHLMRCIRRNIPVKDIPFCVNLISIMIATQALNDPGRLSFQLRLVRDNLLRDPKTYEDACSLVRRYLRRFHVSTPKELIPTP